MALESGTLPHNEDRPEPEEGSFSPQFVARHSRRLSDKVLAAFHHACDLGDYEVAEKLLLILEGMTTRRAQTEEGSRRKNIQGLVAAHERLWHLKHPQTS